MSNSTHELSNPATGGQVSSTSEVQYADSSLQQQEQHYYYIPDDNILHQEHSIQPADNQYHHQDQRNQNNQSEDVVLELVPDAITEAKDVFTKKEIFALKNEKEKDQAAKVSGNPLFHIKKIYEDSN